MDCLFVHRTVISHSGVTCVWVGITAEMNSPDACECEARDGDEGEGGLMNERGIATPSTQLGSATEAKSFSINDFVKKLFEYDGWMCSQMAKSEGGVTGEV